MSYIRTPKKNLLIGKSERNDGNVQIDVKRGSKTDTITIPELLGAVYNKPIETVFISFRDGSTTQIKHHENNLTDNNLE